jgi:hypothetical protein
MVLLPSNDLGLLSDGYSMKERRTAETFLKPSNLTPVGAGDALNGEDRGSACK